MERKQWHGKPVIYGGFISPGPLLSSLGQRTVEPGMETQNQRLGGGSVKSSRTLAQEKRKDVSNQPPQA